MRPQEVGGEGRSGTRAWKGRAPPKVTANYLWQMRGRIGPNPQSTPDLFNRKSLKTVKAHILVIFL